MPEYRGLHLTFHIFAGHGKHDLTENGHFQLDPAVYGPNRLPSLSLLKHMLQNHEPVSRTQETLKLRPNLHLNPPDLFKKQGY